MEQNNGIRYQAVHMFLWLGCFFTSYCLLVNGSAAAQTLHADSLSHSLSREPIHGIHRLTSLSRHVERRSNGDVIVSGVPMVNQGDSAFCGPATWERYLHYVGVDADMHLLENARNVDSGGRMSRETLENTVQNLLHHYGYVIEPVASDLTIEHLAPFLERGLPLVWACNNPPSLDREITRRSEERENYRDWDEYKKEARAFRKKYSKEIVKNGLQGTTPYSHLRLIIGYNPQTDEIAVSDTYGDWAQERWMTLMEARAVSLGYLRIVK